MNTDQPGYDDRDGQVQYGLAMPFTCVVSKGGPYDDVSFVAGFQMGQLDRRLENPNLRATTALIYEMLEQQADLLAMHHGCTMEVLHREDGWLHVGFDGRP